MKNKRLLFICFLLVVNLPLHSLSINIRSFDHDGFTRLVFEGDRGFEYKLNNSKKELTIRLQGRAALEKGLELIENSRLVERVVHKIEKKSSVFNVYFKSGYRIDRHFVLERPFRVVFDLVGIPEQRPAARAERSSDANPPPQERPGQKESKNDNKIDIICLDAGHGGNDLGAIGSTKITEKEITLKVCKKLQRLIESRRGLRVILTREEDIEVSLDNRVALANNQKADMFVSIHVNGSFRRAASGPETFYVSLKATDEESYRLAQKENQSFGEIEDIADADALKLILWNMAQTEYIKESSKLAVFIQDELNDLLNTENRGVKQAPFRVLMRAAMPAVLVEVAFLSNPGEEKKLSSDAFLDEVANSIYTGISKFIYYQDNLFNSK